MRNSLLTILALTGILLSDLHSDTWTVDTTGAEGDSLQAAVDAAGLSPGIDTVLVEDGTYHLAMNLDTISSPYDTAVGYTGLIMRDSVVLRSEGDRNSCVLTAMSGDSADTAWHVIYCKNVSGSKIIGFTIRDGYWYWGKLVPVSGGGVYCDSASLVVDSCVICDNLSTTGGGVYIVNSLCVVLSGNEVSGNIAASLYHSREGGGIYVLRSNVVLNDNLITRNSAWDYSSGGGMWIGDGSSVTLIGNEISHNGAGGGGGLYIDSSGFSLQDNWIHNNRSNSGGGLFIGGSWGELTDNVITYNRARFSANGLTGCAGGIYIGGGTVTLNNNEIVGDTADCFGGGVMIAGYDCHVTLNNNSITGNVAYSGGGFHVFTSGSSSQVTLHGNLVADNTAHVGGGFLIGFTYFWPHLSTYVTMYDDLVVNNKADSLGAGLLVGDSSEVVLRRCVLAANFGQAIASTCCGGSSVEKGRISVDSCFIVDNGEIYVGQDADTLSISHSNIYYNTFQVDTEIYNYSPISIPLANNFWWDTTESAIGAKIEGPADYTPWMSDFVPGVPGEPVSIDSVRNYANDWTTVVGSIDTLDTLYLCVYGQDRNPDVREAAVVILKSSACPRGIAVALVETDINSGIYQGRACLHEAWATPPIRLDDIYQRIRVQEPCDTIRVIPNTDRTMRFDVVYGGPYVEESRSRTLTVLRLTPNPFADKVVVEYETPGKCNKRIEIYDASGRYVRKLIDELSTPGLHKVIWDGRANNGKVSPQGIYFCKATIGELTTIRKIVKLGPTR